MSNRAVGWSSIKLYIIYFQEVTPQQALTVTSFKQPTRTLWFEGSSLAYSLMFMHDMLMRPDSVCIKVCRESALAASSSAGWTTDVLDASHCAHHWGDRKWCLIQFLYIVCVYWVIKRVEYVKQCMWTLQTYMSCMQRFYLTFWHCGYVCVLLSFLSQVS